MAQPRLIALDLDGTLLDPTGAITPRTQHAIAMAHARGVAIVLATARRYRGTVQIARHLRAVDALAVYDGAQAHAFPSGDVMFSQRLHAGLAQRVVEVIAHVGLQPIAQHATSTHEHLVVGPRPGRARWADVYLANVAQEVVHVPLDQVCAGGADPVRLVAFGPLRRVRQAARAIAAHFSVGAAIKAQTVVGTSVLPVGSYGAAELTVFAPGVSKGAALARLAERFKVPMAQTMAIGDGINDVPMLRAAGVSVAMGGAPRAVLHAADMVTATNREDGVARIIETLVLGANASVSIPARRHGAARSDGEEPPAANG